MSKKHKKNRGSLSAPAPAAESVTTPSEETLIGVDDLGIGEVFPSEEAFPSEEQLSAESSPDNAVNDATPPDADPAEEQPTAEPTPAVLPELPPKKEDPNPAPDPKPTMASPVVVPTKPAVQSAPSVQVKGSVTFVRPTAIKRVGSVVKTSKVPTAQNTVKKLDDLRGHSVIGIKVITMFNEYEEMRRTFDLSNPVYRNKCARKLYDIMTICCPHRNGANAQSMSELANIVFTRFCNGIGTLYTDKSLLAGDYNLPTPAEAIKFDAFYGAMYQLAECAKFGTRITFNVKSLETLLQSTGASLAIRDIKARLDAKMAQRAQEAKLGK